MAWYGVDYTCGHSDRMQVYGPTRDRQAIADREGRKDCPNCYREKQDKIRDAAADVAAKEAVAKGLPELAGSTAQIKWALTLRAKAEGNIALALARYSEALNQNALAAAPLVVPPFDEFVAFANRVLRQNSAKYWIDRRDSFVDANSTSRYLFRRASEEHDKATGAAMLCGR